MLMMSKSFSRYQRRAPGKASLYKPPSLSSNLCFPFQLPAARGASQEDIGAQLRDLRIS